MKAILVDARNTFVTENWIFQEMKDVLDIFPNKKIIVTNANDEQLVTLWIVNMPYEVYTLKHNPDKTDPLYFKTLLQHFWLTTDEVLYFEHNKDAVKSASSLGIISYHYNKDTKDLESLKKFLKENL